ncbi:hypothetical protein D3C87_1716210 [compost metagenome]
MILEVSIDLTLHTLASRFVVHQCTRTAGLDELKIQLHALSGRPIATHDFEKFFKVFYFDGLTRQCELFFEVVVHAVEINFLSRRIFFVSRKGEGRR